MRIVSGSRRHILLFIFSTALAATPAQAVESDYLSENQAWCERNRVTLNEGNEGEIRAFKPTKIYFANEFVIPRAQPCSEEITLAPIEFGISKSTCQVCQFSEPPDKERRTVIIGDKTIGTPDDVTATTSVVRKITSFNLVMTTKAKSKYKLTCTVMSMAQPVSQKDFFCKSLPAMGVFFPGAPDLPKILENRVELKPRRVI